MIAKFEFNLPEDKEDFNIYNQAPGMNHAIWEFDQWLRSTIKYGGTYNDNGNEVSYAEKDLELFQRIRDKLYELLNEEGVDLY